MNTIKMLFWSFLLVTQICQAMVVEKKTSDVQILNATGAPVTIEFKDKLKMYSAGPPKINRTDIPEMHTNMNADDEVRYTRILKPGGIFDITNFGEDQDITATSENLAPLNIGKEVKKVFDKPGTKIVRLAIEKPSGIIKSLTSPQKKLIAIVNLDPRTLQELKKLGEGPVIKIEEGYTKQAKKALSDMITDKEQKDAYDKFKEDKDKITPTLGAWGKIMVLILDDNITKLTENDVYRTIGLSESATPQEFFNPILLGKAADTSPKDLRQNLLGYFRQDLFFQGGNPYLQKAQNKAKIVNQMILENYAKIQPA